MSPPVAVLEPIREPVTRQAREAVGAGVSRHEPCRVSHGSHEHTTTVVYLLRTTARATVTMIGSCGVAVRAAAAGGVQYSGGSGCCGWKVALAIYGFTER